MKFFLSLALAVFAATNVHADNSLISGSSASNGLDPECPKIVCAAIMSWEECASNLPEKCRPKNKDLSAWEEHALLYGTTSTESSSKESATTAQQDKTTECSDICPDVFSPVCGSNGLKYANPCRLKAAACKNPALNIVEAGDEVCDKVK